VGEEGFCLQQKGMIGRLSSIFSLNSIKHSTVQQTVIPMEAIPPSSCPIEEDGPPALPPDDDIPLEELVEQLVEEPPPAPPPMPPDSALEVTDFELGFLNSPRTSDPSLDRMVSFPQNLLVVQSIPKIHRTLNSTKPVPPPPPQGNVVVSLRQSMLRILGWDPLEKV